MPECIWWKFGRPSGSVAIISTSRIKDSAGNFSAAATIGQYLFDRSVAIAGEGTCAGPVEDPLGPVAVVLDLMQPIVADRRRLDLDGLQGLDELQPLSGVTHAHTQPRRFKPRAADRFQAF